MLKKPLPGSARLMLGAGLAVLASSATAAVMWTQQPATVVSLPAVSVATAVAPLPPLAVESRVATPAPSATISLALAPAAAAPVAPVAPVPLEAPLKAERIYAYSQNPPLPPPTMPSAVVPDPEPSLSLAPGTDPGVGDADYQPPSVRLAKAARIPKLADVPRNAVLTGGIVMRVSIDATGKPVDVQVHESRLTPMFERNALAAVKRWRFEPARRGGRAEAATVLVPVWFRDAPEAPTIASEGLSHPLPRNMDPPQIIAGQ